MLPALCILSLLLLALLCTVLSCRFLCACCLAALGVVGFVVVLSLFLRAAPRLRRQSALMLAWLFTILISCLTEDTFGTLAGILFSTYFLAFRDDEIAS